jgi:hypothetical protein
MSLDFTGMATKTTIGSLFPSYNENEFHFHLQLSSDLNMLQRRIDDHAPPSRELMREAQDIFYKHLKRVGLKHTDQRDTILRTFLETRDHLSTDELFRLVRKKDAKIGFTTVYRTAWRAMSTSSTAATTITWSARSATPRSSSFLPK